MSVSLRCLFLPVSNKARYNLLTSKKLSINEILWCVWFFSEPGIFPFFVQELLLYRDSINSRLQIILRHWIGILLDILLKDIWIYQCFYPAMKRARLYKHPYEFSFLRRGGSPGLFHLLSAFQEGIVNAGKKKNGGFSLCFVLGRMRLSFVFCFLFFPFICFAIMQLLLRHRGSFCQSQRWGYAWLKKSKINLLSHTSTLNAAWNIIVSLCTLCFKGSVPAPWNRECG